MDGALHGLVAFGAAMLAGAINSVAGGGTLVSFPVLIWLGLPAITANATSTVAIWPGSLGGMLGFRRELRLVDRRVFALVVPSLVGGVAGAWLLQHTSSGTFDRVVPFLVYLATGLFLIQGPVQRWMNTSPHGPVSVGWMVGLLVMQLLVGLYGGYFGAGIGILMLAALSIMGLTDIHQMNALKNLFALCINGVAACWFMWMGMVSWSDVLVMAVGAIAGGVLGADVAKRVGRTAVRRVVIGIGLTIGTTLLLRR